MNESPRDPTRLRQPAETMRGVAPLIDVYETENAFVVVADVPGARPDALDVVANRERLTIRARVARPDRAPEYQEFELADYVQAIALTDDLDTDHVSAALKDGVLKITIPKSPSVQPKKIQIRVE